MSTIISGSAATISVTVQRDGAPVPLSGNITARVYSMDGRTEHVAEKAVDSAAAGANWRAGVAVVDLADTETATIPAGEAMLVLAGPFGVRRFSLIVEMLASGARTSLFIRDIAVDRIRGDALMMASSGAFTAVNVSDDYIWDKVRAAESEIAHDLRVPLVPTHFFPDTPTPDEVAALNGAPWGIDPGYDYAPQDFAYNDKWGFIKMRNKPLQAVSRVKFSYPGGPTAQYDLPLDWLRCDKKYGMVQFVPSSSAFAAPLNAFVMQAIGQGRTIPLAIQFTYVAGLADVHKNYPELIDAIMKKAVLKIVQDSFLPQSGSISADGLSQSMSADMSKYGETIDSILNGEKGGNGGLMAAIHGIRFGVLGA